MTSTDRDETVRRNRQDLGQVLASLAQEGIVVDDLRDLFEDKNAYDRAIPVLLTSLQATANYAVKEAIVRCLSTRQARGFDVSPLIAEFDRAPLHEKLFRWAVGNAIDVIGDARVVDDVVRIVADRSNGVARQMFVQALSHLRHPQAVSVLIPLLRDPDVAAHAAFALGRLKAAEAEPALVEASEATPPLVRREAERALKRIRKA